MRLASVLWASASAGLLFLLANGAQAESSRINGWIVEPGVDVPSYAVTEPVRTNLNIDTVVLVCEEGASSRFVQLKLYLSDAGPLTPKGFSETALTRYPRADVVIDGRVFPVRLFPSEGFVLLADAERERLPVLSEHLLDAMTIGASMTLRFALLERMGQLPGFDGEAVIDLQAGRGGRAVEEVGRCASPTGVGVANANH